MGVKSLQFTRLSGLRRQGINLPFSAIDALHGAWHMSRALKLVLLKCTLYVLLHHRILNIPELVDQTITLHFTEEGNETLKPSLWTQVLC